MSFAPSEDRKVASTFVNHIISANNSRLTVKIRF